MRSAKLLPKISFRKGGEPPVRPGIFTNGYRVANWPRAEDPTEEQVAAVLQAWWMLHGAKRIKRPLSDHQVQLVLLVLEKSAPLKRFADELISN